MQEKCCVFVDGENLRYSIVDLFQGVFDKAEYLPKQANWTAFFDWLVKRLGNNIKRFRTYWYTIEHIDFSPYVPLPIKDQEQLRSILSRHKPYKRELEALEDDKLPMRIQQMAAECERKANSMRKRFEGWRRIQDDISHRHERIEYRRAGAISYNLFTGQLGKEKAVDVKLATDMNQLQNIYDIALIVSGDQDYVPAVQVAKDSGKTVINVAFEARNGRLLPGGAKRLNQTTDLALIVKHADIKTHMGL